jgi:HK97 family phage major capsid protein
MDELKEHLATNREKAARLIDRMADGNLSADERSEIKALTRDAKETAERIEKLRSDEDAMATLKAKFPAPGSTSMSAGRKAAHDIAANHKALTTGAVTTAINLGLTGGLARDTRYISELLPAIRTDSPSFAYLRQTVRNNIAAPVQIGATKPTSTYSIVQAQGYAPTIAHVSEPVPEQYLQDEATLAWFLDAEMEHGAMLALDRELLYGDGATLGTSSFEKNIEGFLSVGANLPTQSDTGDVFNTARKAVTTLDLAGEQPSAWVMHPTDWETIETETTNTGEFIMGSQGRSPVNVAERRLWGVQVALSPSIDQGWAMLGDFRTAAELRVRQDIEFRWSDSNDEDFTKNLKRFRSEIRAGLAIHRTPAFVVVDLGTGLTSS